MADVIVDIDIVCEYCGDDLDHCDGDKTKLKIYPCEKCIEKAKKEAKEEAINNIEA